jgi:hypothetical protein
MPKLIAREKFFYNNRNVEAGEEFEAEQQDVALLTDSVSPRAKQPETKTAPEPKRTTTRTRVMKASETAEPSEPTTTEDGRYSRSDMRAED